MFTHIYKYRLKELLRNKSGIFWTLVFPILLGTLFSVTFGGIMSRQEVLKTIPVAVVNENEASYFNTLLTELSKEGDEQVFKLTYVNASEAERLLKDEKTDGIFHVKDTVELKVKKASINQSILSSILDSYVQIENMIKKTEVSNPQQISKMVEAMNANLDLNQEIVLSKGNQDFSQQYFYALLAMTALYASFFGLSNAKVLQANLSAIAARRVTAPFGKVRLLLAEFAAAVTVHFGIMLVVMAYLNFGLKIDFGDKVLPVLFLIFVGSLMGVSMGFFVGCIGKLNSNAKEGLLVCISLFLCFFSGLYINTVKNAIDQTVPILNKINPAVVLSDAFYSLNIYDTYGRYLENIVILLIFTAIFGLGGYLLARRKKYASL